jgi:hypothetical protein
MYNVGDRTEPCGTPASICRAANFAVTTFAKRELAEYTLRKEKSVKIALSNRRFDPITKSHDDLV